MTDCRPHDVGTGEARRKRETAAYDKPTLVECWRTAPYLHDGSAATMMEVLTVKSWGEKHGRTSHLSRRELDELCEYVLSL